MKDSGFKDNSRNRNTGYDKGIYSIPVDKEGMLKFIEEEDYPSSRSLDLFESIGSKLEDKIQKTGGASLFFFSITEERISRDFSALQIANFLSKKGKEVLIVDCDFIEPGLSGLVENVEKHGFLDLLLYGSSLKSVAEEIGVKGVKVISSGSFPVSRTVPFAKKEFDRVNHFLRERSSIIIYCSTLYDDAENINPLAAFVDEIIISCWSEETLKGQLQRAFKDLKTSGFSSVEAISFGDAVDGESLSVKEAQSEEAEEEVKDKEKKIPDKENESEEKIEEEVEEEIKKEPEEIEEKITAAKVTGDNETGFIEKTDEIEIESELSKQGISPLRIVLITVAFFVIVFIAWWQIRGNSIKEDSNSKIIGKAVQTMQEAARDSLQTGVVEKKAAQIKEDTIENENNTVEMENNKIAQEQITENKVPADPGKRSVAGTDGKKKESADKAKRSVVNKPLSGIYYSVHVASFRDIDNAGIEAEYFEKKGFDVFVTQAEVKNTKWFRVLVGRVLTKEEGTKLKMELLSLKKIGYARVVKIDK